MFHNFFHVVSLRPSGINHATVLSYTHISYIVIIVYHIGNAVSDKAKE